MKSNHKLIGGLELGEKVYRERLVRRDAMEGSFMAVQPESLNTSLAYPGNIEIRVVGLLESCERIGCS